MEGLLSKRDVIKLVGVSAVTLWHWMREGRFPGAVRLQKGKFGRVAWYASEVQEWIENRERVTYKKSKDKTKRVKKG